ncbi:competence protein ComGG [Anoxybacillus vitaminiphilus]|jgi:competence protein ComGG|uniref:Competence protein ComGG n=1 Tax=Paranoxybacillus vitaminiphilus TaxID=581036 RepID=A0A327YN37_9BACL|nr:competence type IV pilus minor pilin ComGG [Anoxybacillus vitaminiphilus]RAK22368.1 competence protein ComGG [Anoxybacillus vitaminiphilus]
MNNEKGFILPVTMIFSFFLLLLFVHVIELYKMETEFAAHEQQMYELDGIMQMAVVDVKNKISNLSDTVTFLDETVVYPTGKAHYELKRLGQERINVHVLCISNNGLEYKAEFTLSVPDMELVEWKEKY